MNFRQAMTISQGSPMIFLEKPLSLLLLVLAALALLGPPLWGREDHYRGQAGLNESDLTKAEAAEVLRNRIERFLAATGGGALTPARVRELLRAVLASSDEAAEPDLSALGLHTRGENAR